MNLKDIAQNPELMEIARQAVENELVELRDSRIGILGRGNGLVIREKDGSDSSVIRLGLEHALSIGLEAVAEHLANQ